MGAMTVRALVTGPAGGGKTTLLRSLIRNSPAGGLIVDPLQEIGIRIPRFWNLYPPLGDEGAEMIAGAARSLMPGELVVIDELDAFLPPNYSQSPLRRLLSFARNLELHLALSTKNPTNVPPLVASVSSDILYQPWNVPTNRRWLEAAGLDADVHVPPFHWAHFWQGKIEVVDTAEAVRRLVARM